jgi:HEAT repeat protein
MTHWASHTTLEMLVFAGFAVVLVLWVAITAFVVANRMVFDRRRRRLLEIGRALVDGSDAMSPLDRTPDIRQALSGLSRRTIYGMIAASTVPLWLSESCAAYAIERWGSPQMFRDASLGQRRHKWRRISALFALGHVRAIGVHELLRATTSDADADVAGAAAVILGRLGDRAAAEILIDALRQPTLPASRIAMQLDQFPSPISDLLRPLLHDSLAHTRYWAASLLHRYSAIPGLAAEIAQLVDDRESTVRKAALAALGTAPTVVAIPAARRALADSTGYVRSTAIRVLEQHGVRERDLSRRRDLASWIAPSMADREWEVRLAAKESLVRLGPTVWREVAAYLESPDRFARNSAAEVVQNLGVLDWTLRSIESGLVPEAELTDLVTRAFREGGRAMVDAAAVRALPGQRIDAETPWAGFRFVSASS